MLLSINIYASRIIDVSKFVNSCHTEPMAIRKLPLLTESDACCTSFTGQILDIDTAERLAKTFKALGDPARVRLLSLIAATETGEACICDLTDPVGLSQPTVSHHMKQLADADLVTREQRGKWAYYAINPETLNRLSAALKQ